MPQRSYWIDLFTGTTWQEFLKAGATVSGFRDSRWSAVQRLTMGDYLLCYLTGISRFVAVLEVTSEPFLDHSPIWGQESFPARVNVQIVEVLTPDTAVPIHDLRDELSIFQNLNNPNAWSGHVRGSPSRWKRADGEAVVHAIEEAKRHPVERSVDPRKLYRRPRGIETERDDAVAIPDADEQERTPPTASADESAHTEIEWLLLTLGSDLGLSVWVAPNDRGRTYDGSRFSELPKVKKSLPLQFGEATNRTVERIDVLWLKDTAIVAAFEIESTTSIYSGLLRMADLISMQPNLNIPLYIVAPDDRRNKVIEEVNRPTFSRLPQPMKDVCRFISFEILRKQVREISPWVRYMTPNLLDELSESCELDE